MVNLLRTLKLAVPTSCDLAHLKFVKNMKKKPTTFYYMDLLIPKFLIQILFVALATKRQICVNIANRSNLLPRFDTHMLLFMTRFLFVF
jgi:hypothetical protein